MGFADDLLDVHQPTGVQTNGATNGHHNGQTNGDNRNGTSSSVVLDTDVLVVGAGVTGLTMAALLAEQGIRVYSISHRRSLAPAPRAHITNQRTMELFRALGYEDAVKAVSTPLPHIGNSVMATSLGKPEDEIGRYGCYGNAPDQFSDFAKASPCSMENSPQNLLEPVLLTIARDQGADIRFAHELIHVEQSDDGVRAQISERTTGARYQVTAKYLVAADGANSRVAQQLGFEFIGEAGLARMITAFLHADLTPWVAYRPSCIYWLFNPGDEFWVGSGSCVNARPWDQWTFNRQYDPTNGEPETSPESVIKAFRRIMGLPESLSIKVKNVSKWEVNHVVAKEYRKGRVFLAGDAAHRHPPSSGLGSNTSIQDAWNLAWKLALVVQGKADDAILDSYSQERQPVGQQVVDHAIMTMNENKRLAAVLGFQRGHSSEAGFASVDRLFKDDSPEGEARRKALRDQIESGNRRSSALGVQLGLRYKPSTAIVQDGTAYPTLLRDPILHYEPTTHPGGYVPHAWIAARLGGPLVSTLDVLQHGKFGVIVGVGGVQWAAAAAVLSQEYGVELPVFEIGLRCAYDDIRGEWTKVREITDRGAILVRPDRHIAWRSFDRPANPEEALREAVVSVLNLKANIVSR